MKSRNYRLRQVAVAALGAVTAVSGIAVLGAGQAGATVTGTTITPSSTPPAPYVIPGATAQTAGNLTLNVPNTFQTNQTVSGSPDSIVLQVAPPFGTNGSSAGNTIGFSSAPTVTVSAPTGGAAAGETAPTVTEALSTPGTEPAAAAGTNDTLTLTFTNNSSVPTTTSPATPATNWNITLSNVAYNLGAAVQAGPVNVTATPYDLGVVGAALPPVANATVTAVTLSGNNPPVSVQNGTNGAPISNVVLTEHAPGAVTVGTVTLILNKDAFYANSTPTVTATGGAVVGPVTVSGSQVSFPVSKASTTAGTYTVSGLEVNATSTGPATVTVSGSAPAQPASATAFVVSSLNRIYGQTASDTSAALFAQENYASPGCCSGGNPNAVLATSDNYPDALSAAYLAKSLGTGVLVTPTDAVAPATLTALQDAGVQHVYVVGGPLAISPADIATLQSTPVYYPGGQTQVFPKADLQVTQIYGQTQYDTAQAVAQFEPASGIGTVYAPGAYGGMYNETTGLNGTGVSTSPISGNSAPTAILAVGTNYPDAMAASAMAYGETIPVLLTQTDSLSSQAAGAIVNEGIKQVIVMGGPLAISDNVITQLGAMGVSAFRIAGKDYTDTAQLLAQFELNTVNSSNVTDGLGWVPSANTLVVATGDNFPDALSASQYASYHSSPILLTEGANSVGQYLTSFLNTAGSTGFDGNTYYGLTLLGGPIAITASTANALSAALAS